MACKSLGNGRGKPAQPVCWRRKEMIMAETSDYEALLDEENITAVKERRHDIEHAIDALMEQIDTLAADRKRVDESERKLADVVRQLDVAYAHLSRGVRYSDRSKRRIVRRYWSEDTYDWVEQYLLQWATKQLQEGPVATSTLVARRPGRFSILDVISLMEDHPEEFEVSKGRKPSRKYARAEQVWSLKANRPRNRTASAPRLWNVEAQFLSEQDRRNKTMSEIMHEMLERAIEMAYARQSVSVFAAFAELYSRQVVDGYMSLKAQYELVRILKDQEAKVTAETEGRNGAPNGLS
jgi:hypothetical protein